MTCSLTVKWHVFFLMTIWWKTWNSFKRKVMISSVLSQYVVHWHLCCAGFPSLDCSRYGQEKRKGGSWLYKQGLRNWLIFKSLQPLIQDDSLHLQCTSVGITTVGSDIIIGFFYDNYHLFICIRVKLVQTRVHSVFGIDDAGLHLAVQEDDHMFLSIS